MHATYVTGSCVELESCKGDPPNCYCDSLCHLFKDCCPDAGNKSIDRAIRHHYAKLMVVLPSIHPLREFTGNNLTSRHKTLYLWLLSERN